MLFRNTVLLILTVCISSPLVGQTSYPIEAQPQGGDRRGSYLYADEEAQKLFDKTGQIPRLYKDPKLYLHKMTLLAHVPGRFGGGEMMTLGGNRYVVAGRTIIDVTDPKHPAVVNDKASGGQVAYNKTLGKWVVMQTHQFSTDELDVVQGKKGITMNPPPGTKVGVTFWDITDPRNPAEISHFSTGPGSHGVHGDGVYYDGGKYAWLSSRLPGFRGQLPYEPIEPVLQIIDVSDLKNPKEVSRWWVPGQLRSEEAEFMKWPEAEAYVKQLQEKTWSPDWKYDYLHFHGPCIPNRPPEEGGSRAYCAWGALGMRLLDVSDMRQPKLLSTLDISPPFDAGIPVHSVYPIPQRKLLIINGETTRWDCHEGVVRPWVVDMRAEKYPMTIAAFPLPKPPAESPYNDYCFRGGRFGTHHPNNYKAPGEMRLDLIGFSWFEGGWHLYDISDPFRPEDVAWMVPPQGDRRGTEAGLIEWDRKIIHVFSDTGLYILSAEPLGDPVLGPLKPERWSPEGLNLGAP